MGFYQPWSAGTFLSTNGIDSDYAIEIRLPADGYLSSLLTSSRHYIFSIYNLRRLVRVQLLTATKMEVLIRMHIHYKAAPLDLTTSY